MGDDVRTKALVDLNLGNEYPFDGPDDGDAEPVVDCAHAAARGIMRDLCDRRGIKHALDDVDEESRVDIVQSIAEIIRAAYETYAETAMRRFDPSI